MNLFKESFIEFSWLLVYRLKQNKQTKKLRNPDLIYPPQKYSFLTSPH